MVTDTVSLGIIDGISDAGAALFVGERLIAAVNEERLARRKLAGGFPALSIAKVLEIADVEASDVERIAVAGVATPTVSTRIFRGLQQRLAPTAGIALEHHGSPLQQVADLVRYRVPITTNRADSRLGRLEGVLALRRLRKEFGTEFAGARIELVEHHLAHAAAAFHASPYDDALVVTADSLGDGLSLTVSDGHGRRLDRRFAVGAFASLGTFFALVTRHLGFTPYRHEGKVVALAAAGDAGRVDVPFPFRMRDNALVYDGHWGLRAWKWLERLRGHAREDVAAWLQAGTESRLAEVVGAHVADGRNLCVAGGVFANVRLNLTLLETPGVERLSVFPHMGDGGLAVGAVLALLRPETWDTSLFLGPGFDERQCADALRGRPHNRPADIEGEVAALLARGCVVARFHGRMEYGPRALGHRSVLAEAWRPDIREELNQRLDRTVFMPFAPVLRAEDAAQSVQDTARAPACARQMTCAFRATPAFRRNAPGAVHIDGTTRCQIVSADTQPGLHRILERYTRLTGRTALINTSFNRHEEPIVCTPNEAMRAFLASGIDALQLGPFLAIRNDVARSRGSSHEVAAS